MKRSETRVELIFRSIAQFMMSWGTRPMWTGFRIYTDQWRGKK